MPIYCYSRDGAVVEEMFPLGQAPAKVKRDGRWYVRDYHAEGRGGRSATAEWPMLSDALGVGPDQIVAAKQDAARAGIPTDFTPDGRAILRSPKHRKALAEHYGFYDRNSYGTRLEAERRT